MRWTRRRRETSGADRPSQKLRRDRYQDRRAAFAEGFRGRRSRVVLTPRRWRQVGGSDSAGDSGKQARSLGRARRKPLKPLRAGMPGVCGVLVVTNARVYYTTRGCGCAGTRHSPRPLSGRRIYAQPGRYPRRGSEDACPSCCCPFSEASDKRRRIRTPEELHAHFASSQ